MATINIKDICELYGFDAADERFHPMYTFLEEARNSIMSSGVKQSECFFAINNDLVRSLGFESNNDFMTCLRRYHTRADSVFWDNVIPVERTLWYYTERGLEAPSNIVGEREGDHPVKTLGVTRDPTTNVLKMNETFLGKMIVPSAVNVFSRETTLVRCGFFGSCTVPTYQSDKKRWNMMVLVLDLDCSLVGPKTAEIPVESLGVLQMIQFDHAEVAEVLAKYLTLRSDPRIGQVVIHDKYPGSMTLRVASAKPLTQRELLGDDLHHELDLTKVAEGGYKMFSVWPAENPGGCANLNPWRHWGDHNDNAAFYRFINARETRVLTNMAFSSRAKEDILIWLTFNAYLVEKVGKENCVIIINRTMIESLRHMLWDDNILRYEEMYMTNPSGYVAKRMYSSFPAVDALCARRTPDGKKVIVNPLTYPPEGGMCYAFTPDNLYEVFTAWVSPDPDAAEPDPWRDEATLRYAIDHIKEGGEEPYASDNWFMTHSPHLKDVVMPFYRAVMIVADPEKPYTEAVKALNTAAHNRRFNNIVEAQMLLSIKESAIAASRTNGMQDQETMEEEGHELVHVVHSNEAKIKENMGCQ